MTEKRIGQVWIGPGKTMRLGGTISILVIEDPHELTPRCRVLVTDSGGRVHHRMLHARCFRENSIFGLERVS